MNYSRIWTLLGEGAAALIWSVGAGAQAPAGSETIAEADCTAAKLGDSIPITSIGEPVSAVALSAPRWNAAAKAFIGNLGHLTTKMFPPRTSFDAPPLRAQGGYDFLIGPGRLQYGPECINTCSSYRSCKRLGWPTITSAVASVSRTHVEWNRIKTVSKPHPQQRLELPIERRADSPDC